MELIVITEEKLFAGEAEAVNLLFEEGLELLHLRKPEATPEEIGNLLGNIKEAYHNRIVLHDHFQLAARFAVKGLHLNRRNNTVPAGFNGTKSRSCHTLAELAQYPDMDYLFLSPVFDSISKGGYRAAFPEQALSTAQKEDVINHRVIALGGIRPENIAQVQQWGFGGVAVLGFLWSNYSFDKDKEALVDRFNQLKNVLS